MRHQKTLIFGGTFSFQTFCKILFPEALATCTLPTFIPVDAAAILCTPARIQNEDVWAWEPKKHGVYSVRSAYRLLDMVRIRENEVQFFLRCEQ